MVEVRQHTDGRVALRTPHVIDDIRKGDCNWMVIEYYSPTDARIRIDLLTDDEVTGDGWMPLCALDEHATQRLAERLYRDYEREYEASHLNWKNFEGDARRYIGALTQMQDQSSDEPQ